MKKTHQYTYILIYFSSVEDPEETLDCVHLFLPTAVGEIFWKSKTSWHSWLNHLNSFGLLKFWADQIWFSMLGPKASGSSLWKTVSLYLCLYLLGHFSFASFSLPVYLFTLSFSHFLLPSISLSLPLYLHSSITPCLFSPLCKSQLYFSSSSIPIYKHIVDEKKKYLFHS